MVQPDICFDVQKVARCVAQPTHAAVTEGKRILRYMKGAAKKGLEYSAKKEAEFRKVYGEIAKAGGHRGELPDAVAFSDSDFAGCTVFPRSTSGSILYHRGVPIGWKSQRQSVRALSTCEAEYVAIFDTIRLSLAQGFLEWLQENDEVPLTFVDNQSALALSKQEHVSKRPKHINLRYHTLRDHVRECLFVCLFVWFLDQCLRQQIHKKQKKHFREWYQIHTGSKV